MRRSSASVDLRYTPEEAQKHVLGADARRSATDYTDVVQRAFNERWIDFFPTEGKRSGAYSNGGAYDVHPYMLLNYLGQYNDVSTLAHELGHTMQSYYSNKTQPYPLANYPTFVAEVASTFNEALLIDHMLKQIKDTPTRLSLLGNYLESIKAHGVPPDAVRGVRAADARDGAERGEPITGDALAKLLSRHHAQVLRPRPEASASWTTTSRNEWSFIPHFYRDFYVFQYATSFTAAEALSAKVLAGDQDARHALSRRSSARAGRSIRSIC